MDMTTIEKVARAGVDAVADLADAMQGIRRFAERIEAKELKEEAERKVSDADYAEAWDSLTHALRDKGIDAEQLRSALEDGRHFSGYYYSLRTIAVRLWERS